MLDALGLRAKIFVLVTAVVIVSFMTTAWVVTIKTVDMAKEEAFNLAAETADKYKNEIKAELQGARVTSETLSTVFETLKTHNLTSRHMMNDILQKALKNKEYITILCIAYMPNALDGKDHQYAGVKPAYSPSGRYALYWNKLGSRIELEPLPDKDIEASDWWNVPKTTKHEFITDPYLYHIQGHPVMLASLVFPILYQGEFIGIIASDIALDKLQEMVSRKNTHISGGYTQIFSNSGSIVAHSDKRYLGKNISETLASSDSQTVNEVKDAIKNGKTYVLSGNDFYTVYTPIHFSEVTRPWSVAVSIPMADVLQRANYIRNYIIAVFAFFVVLLAIVLYLLTRSLTQPIRQLADAARELGEGNFNVEMPLIKSNDEIGMLSRTFRSMVAEIDSLIGRLQGYARELEGKNKALNQLNELKDEFLANTSHELRTPINGIIGIVESMVDGATGPLSQEQKYNLAIVANSGKRLSNMVNDILDFTKLKNHEISLQIKPVDLKTIVDVVLVLSKPLTKGKDLTLENEIDASLPLIEADENRIQQILFNLIGNAIKFTEKGKVSISAHEQEGMMAITISDTGIGIPADKFDRIFESFEQADGSTEREYGGSGLGLSITKKLVELHSGIISVDSHIGEGSSFTFTIPVSDARKEDMAQPTQQKSIIDMEDFILEGTGVPYQNISQNAPKILIVDDEPVNIQVLKNLLSVQHYSVTTAYSGMDALRQIEKEEQFDLVLLDVMMPKMSGYDVCRKIRERYSLFDLPVLMLTAKNQPQDVVLGFQSGANDYLQKPFDKTELMARVNTLLALKQAVVMAIDSEKQFENEKQKLIFEQTLREVTNAITSTLDLKDILNKVLEALSHFVHFDKSAVVLEEEGNFVVKVSNGFNAETAQEDALVDAMHDPLCSQVIQSGKIVTRHDPTGFFQESDNKNTVLAGVPITYRDVLLGVIVINCQDGNISNDLLLTLAGQAGVAIQNARLFEKLNALATTDSLTGLNNRMYFLKLTEREFAKYKRYGNPLSIFMIDIDDFKNINDTYGHATGDAVLRHLGTKLDTLMRECDIVGRYGGEEFIAALPETSLDTATAFAERLRKAIEADSVHTEKGNIHYTLSIGVSTLLPTTETLFSAIETADEGLYEAKRKGKNKVVAKNRRSVQGTLL